MHEAKAAAKTSSGVHIPSFPPNDGGGLTATICLPFTVNPHSVPPFHVAVPSKFNSGIKNISKIMFEKCNLWFTNYLELAFFGIHHYLL
jgi:hypothetical protein